MGIHLNPDNIEFYRATNSEIYVDKTELIRFTNRYPDTEHRNLCVSRPLEDSASLWLLICL